MLPSYRAAHEPPQGNSATVPKITPLAAMPQATYCD